MGKISSNTNIYKGYGDEIKKLSSSTKKMTKVFETISTDVSNESKYKGVASSYVDEFEAIKDQFTLLKELYAIIALKMYETATKFDEVDEANAKSVERLKM